MQESEYDASADIWSLGITVLEMAHGHAPFAKMAPMKASGRQQPGKAVVVAQCAAAPCAACSGARSFSELCAE